jgi:hypothetical protein
MHSAIRQQLLKIQSEDQEMRSSDVWDISVDRRNTNALKKIIDKIGWPTISKVETDAARAAWLIAQHADHDVEFQRVCLELMKVAEQDAEAEPMYRAYLEDRVLKNTNQPQRYGTQFYQKNGQLVVWPIEDPEHVDNRRAQVDLGSFDEYKSQMLSR